MVFYLAIRRASLTDVERIFLRSFEASHYHTVYNIRRYILGSKILSLQSKFSLLSNVKTLKSGKAAGCNEIPHEMLKVLNRQGVLWLTRVCQLLFWKGIERKTYICFVDIEYAYDNVPIEKLWGYCGVQC